MPRGGARPGAGRKRKPFTWPGTGTFDPVDRLQDIPPGPIGCRRRVVLLMAAYSIPPREIAAALAMHEAHVVDFFAEELRLGALLSETNLLAATWQRARAGHYPAISWLLKRMDSVQRNLR